VKEGPWPRKLPFPSPEGQQADKMLLSSARTTAHKPRVEGGGGERLDGKYCRNTNEILTLSRRSVSCVVFEVNSQQKNAGSRSNQRAGKGERRTYAHFEEEDRNRNAFTGRVTEGGSLIGINTHQSKSNKRLWEGIGIGGEKLKRRGKFFCQGNQRAG